MHLDGSCCISIEETDWLRITRGSSLDLRHTTDVREDESRAMDLFMTGLGPTYVGIHIEGHTLESVIQEARQLER